MTATPTAVQLEGLVPGTWTIDASHSDISFTVRHLMSKVRGQFTSFEGELNIAENQAESSAKATIQIDSIDTRNADRDAHLRSADFFSAEEHNTMTFASTGASVTDSGITVTGDLTIKGTTKSVDLAVEFLGVGADPWGNTRAGFEATTKISRKDWDVSFNIPLEGDKLVIGDTINISISVEAVLQA